MVQSIGQSDIFYPTVLKCLKRDYGNLTIVSYLKLNELFNQPQLQAKNKPDFQQQLKTTVIWLSSMGYHSAIRSSDNITKAVTRLPNYLRNKFYKEFKSNDIDEKVDLLKFSHWLDERLSEVHNPVALIIHAEEKQKKKLETSFSKHKDSNRIHSLLEDNKDDQTDQENFKIICWLCTGIHKIANCEKLKNEFIENRHSLVKQKKLCFNCLSNTHMINTCKCKRHCQVDNCQKRYHTLLHSEGMRVPNSPDQIDSNINNIIEKEILSQTYLQL